MANFSEGMWAAVMEHNKQFKNVPISVFSPSTMNCL